MIIKEIKKIEKEAVKNILFPKNKTDKQTDLDGIFGYDTEYTKDRVLSVQLSAFKDGEIVSKCFFLSENVKLSSQFLYICILQMCNLYELKKPRTIYLIAHFSQADISNLIDFEYLNLMKNKTTGLMEVSGTYLGTLAPNKSTIIKVYDTFAYFKTGLAKIGDILGFEKLDVSKHYKENMDQLLKDDRDLFIRYANRDAEITLVAYKRLLEIANKYGVDLKTYPTAPSLALAVFRSSFLQYATEKYEEKEYIIDDKKQTFRYYAGNKRIRTLALKSYWGGRNEAYYYGIKHFKHPIGKVYDVKSLYPSASQLQPLPNEKTKWTKLSDRIKWDKYEGFLSCEFEFPENEMYPCLPVHDGEYLIFCKKGISNCTIAEAREALKLGCKIKIISGYGFIPTANEINHDLKAFMRYFMDKKDHIDKKKDPFDYEFTKLMMNSLIGKFVQRKKVTDMVKVSQQINLPLDELMGMKSYKLDSIMGIHTNIILGSGFSPEWASLILGKARALMGSIIAANHPYMAITDSILIDHPLRECDATRELAIINSGLENETPDGVDSFYIMRLRCYFLYKNKDLVKHAVGGLGVRKTDLDFLEDVRHYVFNHIPLPTEIERKALAKFKESFKRGYKWNSEILRESKPNYAPDKKRYGHEGWTDAIDENFGNFETLKVQKIIEKSMNKGSSDKSFKKKGLLIIKNKSN